MSFSRTDGLGGARRYLAAHGQRLISLYFFANILGFVGWQGWRMHASGRLDFVEISFIVQNLAMAAVVLARREHFAFDRNAGHQLVAAVAFFSGLAFIGEPQTGDGNVTAVAQAIMLVANLLGTVTLINLGNSFGVLIARRGVKTGGLYRLVRHPMYASDMLLRAGFVLSHATPLVAVVFVLSCACYVYRAVLEERFLAHDPEYRAYMNAVPCRFIPFVY